MSNAVITVSDDFPQLNFLAHPLRYHHFTAINLKHYTASNVNLSQYCESN